jgi:redox-sensitive bicupin YhaK (pirin superfamily)
MILNIILEPSAQFTLPKASAGINRTLFIYKGVEVAIGGRHISEYHAADVNESLDTEIANGKDSARILVLQGKPIKEPVVQHGPFVMNTREEIAQAFQDYHRTQFGGWPWPRPDQVHAKENGRFARHADGRIETKG